MSTNELSIAFVYANDVLAAAIILPAVGLIVVSTRLWIRRWDKLWARIDDWLILGAWVFVAGIGAAQIYGVTAHGLGYASPPYATPEAELTEQTPQQRITELVDWVTWVLMIPANGLIKLSTLFLYQRLFIVTRRNFFDMLLWVVIGICTLWTISFFFVTIFGCGKNFTHSWGPLEEIGSCNTNVRLDALMISDLITDCIVWVLPMPAIWQTQMKVSKKIAASCILLLAALSLAAAIVRLIIQEQISNGGYAAHTDVDLTLTNLLYWSMVESGLALIASCLPTLRLNTLPSALSQLAFNVRESLVPTSRSDTSISKASGNRSTSNQKGMSKTHKWIPASHPGMAPSFRSDSSSQCSPLMDMPLPELPPAHKGTFYLEP